MNWYITGIVRYNGDEQTLPELSLIGPFPAYDAAAHYLHKMAEGYFEEGAGVVSLEAPQVEMPEPVDYLESSSSRIKHIPYSSHGTFSLCDTFTGVRYPYAGMDMVQRAYGSPTRWCEKCMKSATAEQRERIMAWNRWHNTVSRHPQQHLDSTLLWLQRRVAASA